MAVTGIDGYFLHFRLTDQRTMEGFRIIHILPIFLKNIKHIRHEPGSCLSGSCLEKFMLYVRAWKAEHVVHCTSAINGILKYLNSDASLPY